MNYLSTWDRKKISTGEGKFCELTNFSYALDDLGYGGINICFNWRTINVYIGRMYYTFNTEEKSWITHLMWVLI